MAKKLYVRKQYDINCINKIRSYIARNSRHYLVAMWRTQPALQ